jgi:hypothetical protein
VTTLAKKRKGADTDVTTDSFVFGDRNHCGIFGFGVIVGLIKHQEKKKEGFYEKDTVSGRCSGIHGSSNTMCFGSSKVAGI